MKKRLRKWFFVNRANLVTTIRLIASAWLVISALYSDNQLVLMLVLVAICGLTDWFDGWVARKYNIVSQAGAFLDRMADKFFICPAIFILVWKYGWTAIHPVVRVLTGGLVLVILLLETLLIISGLVGWFKGLSIESNKWGKWKMGLQSLAVFIWFLSLSIEYYLNFKVLHLSIYLTDAILIFTIGLAVKSIEGYFQRWQH